MTFRKSILVGGVVLSFVFLLGCRKGGSASDRDTSKEVHKLTVGVAFESLQTEFWVASLEAIRAELKARDFNILEAVADRDANRQLEQVKNFITRKVDGIILIPTDAQTCLPMIKAANAAHIPIVLFNRPPDKSDARSVAVVADNFALTRETVNYLVTLAKQRGHQAKGMLLLGDLGDTNAVRRRDGFETAVNENPGAVDIVARIPTEWTQEKAQAGVVNAFQAHPDIDFIFTSSDFLLPSIVSALKSNGKYIKVGHPGHVILGGFDGDKIAYTMLRDQYLDATGVQNVYFEATQAVQAIVDLRAGKEVPPVIQDPGFVITQKNLAERADQMWGSGLRK